MRSLAFATLTIMLFAAPCMAQITSWNSAPRSSKKHGEHSLTISGLFSMPRGEFGSLTGNTAGFAGAGGGFVLDLTNRYRHDLEAGSALFIELDRTNSNAIAGLLASQLEQLGANSTGLTLSTSSWNLFWSMGKLGYSPKVSPSMRVFVDVCWGGVVATSPRVAIVESAFGKGKLADSKVWIGPAGGGIAGVVWRDHLTVSGGLLSGSISHTLAADDFHPISTAHLSVGYVFRR